MRDLLDEGQRRQLRELVDDQPPWWGRLSLRPLDNLVGQIPEDEVADPLGGVGAELALVEVQHHQPTGVEPLDEPQRGARLVEHVVEVRPVHDVSDAGIGVVHLHPLLPVVHGVEDVHPVVERLRRDGRAAQQVGAMVRVPQGQVDVGEGRVASGEGQAHRLGHDLLDLDHDRWVDRPDADEDLEQRVGVELKIQAITAVEVERIQGPVVLVLGRLVWANIDHAIEVLGPLDHLLGQIPLHVDQQHALARISESLEEVALRHALAEAGLADDVDAPQVGGVDPQGVANPRVKSQQVGSTRQRVLPP